MLHMTQKTRPLLDISLIFLITFQCILHINVFEWCPIADSKTLSQTQMVSDQYPKLDIIAVHFALFIGIFLSYQNIIKS